MGDVPQATLGRILSIVRAVTPRARDTSAIAARSGVPYRHAQYAISAARVLGLITGPADAIRVTATGRALAESAPDSRAEFELLCRSINSSALITTIAPGLLGPKPPKKNEVAARILAEGDYSLSTADHRARMLLKWRDILRPRQQKLGLEVAPQAHLHRQREPARRPVPMTSEHDELIEIRGGNLGPLPPCHLRFRPFTVLVGPQGSGKSLLAQVLYFFRALPELIPAEVAGRRRGLAKELSSEALVKSVLDGLRSPLRSFAVFADPYVTVKWSAEGEPRTTYGFGAYSRERRVRPDKYLSRYVTDLVTQYKEFESRAIFIPTERLFYSQVRSPLAPQLLSLPNTYLWFTEWMQRSTAVFESWKEGAPDSPRGKWVRDRARTALNGEAFRWRETWRWRFPRSGSEPGTLDLDMASSGQRATWPIVLLAETLFSLRRRGKLHDSFTLYVEEPEIHLHPEAQVAVVEILAYLVRNGFRVVVTTHSLTVLYALNNLVLAGSLPSRKASDQSLPPEVASLSKSQVAAYALRPEGPQDLVDPETGFISERELGQVAEQLSETMNVLTTRIFSPREAAPK